MELFNAKFERSCLKSVREKLMFTFLVKSGNCQLPPLNTCGSKNGGQHNQQLYKISTV